jgi:L-seryl-tRNA(Ser) seleniumtransferase
MATSGCRLREVGTTNRTALEDYERAIGPDTGAIMKAHRSNYKIVGFAVEADVEEIVGLGRRTDLPVLYDLGSGAVVDMGHHGLEYEPWVRDVVRIGTDCVTFSADKLMGGPQAGIAVGTSAVISKMKRNPLARALRVGKLTLAALEGTLRTYLESPDVFDAVPALRTITEPYPSVSRRAGRIARSLRAKARDKLDVQTRKGSSMIGGGSFPEQELETRLVSLSPRGVSVETYARRLRLGTSPVFARIEENRLFLDARTIRGDQVRDLISALCEALRG